MSITLIYLNMKCFINHKSAKKHFGVMSVVIETNIIVSPRMSTAQSPLLIMVIPT